MKRSQQGQEGKVSASKTSGFQKLWAVCATGEHKQSFQGRPLTDYSPNKRAMYNLCRGYAASSRDPKRKGTRTTLRSGKRAQFIVCRKSR